MNPAPIGVFDSGLGGLTAVRELRRVLPGENIVYFGDTGRVPYGNRSAETILKFSRQNIAFLLSKGVKSVVAACGTASSTIPPAISDVFPVPFVGVIDAATRAAAAASQTGRVGVVATETAIASGSYQTALSALRPGINVFAAPCPLFVPLVEYGHFAPGDAMAALAIEEYLTPIREAKVDTLILGCTHYPLLASSIAAFMGEEVTLVDPGREAALQLQEALAQKDNLSPRNGSGSTHFYVSAAPLRFDHLSAIFLGECAGAAAQQIDIEAYHL